jgi:NADH-quinone oxidoreductase subunit N
MNSPEVWILFPGFIAVILFTIQRWERLVIALGTVFTAGLALTAWLLPAKELFFIGSLTIRLANTWSLLGRRFILGPSERPAIIVLYMAAAFWFGATYMARPGRWFVPLGLFLVALLTAAIAVAPFLYAALLIEMAVLVSVPLLIPLDKTIKRGVLRYLTYQSLGMPFILFTGWMLSGVEAIPTDPALIIRVTVLFGLGFAFLLGIFPFHTWIPMLAEESHPYSTAFVLLLLQGAILFLGLRFLDNYSWLRTSGNVYSWLRWVGTSMVVLSGVWAIFQRNLGRLFGYAVMFEIGISLVTISLGEQGVSVSDTVSTNGFSGTLGIFYAALLPRGLALGVWSLALSVVKSFAGGLNYSEIQGMGRRLPLTTSGIILAHFSLVGLPLLAGSPARLAMLDGLAQVSPAVVVWLLIGMVGLLLSGLRSLAVLVMGPDENWRSLESVGQDFFLVLGIMGLFIVGLFPHWFLTLFSNLPKVFQQFPR